ncbi:hypothetical protein E4T66_19125 [Sinimarinibacterium sp. CAU 1509]|nr:hypothetical protein E4T66_19125 [Sinimarinibacterium sp. CAU 1509]
MLRVTTGMRPGAQRLELAIEVFWTVALETLRAMPGSSIPWETFATPGHPLRGLLEPIRLMIRSELIQSGMSQPDTLTHEVLLRILDVAERETSKQKPDHAARELLYRWLERCLHQGRSAAVAPPLAAQAA